MIDDEPTEEELREAAALAEALERGAGTALPEDALETAALLRHSVDGGELSNGRSAKILDGVLAAGKPRPAEKRTGGFWKWLLFPASGATIMAAAAALLFVMSSGDEAEVASMDTGAQAAASTETEVPARAEGTTAEAGEGAGEAVADTAFPMPTAALLAAQTKAASGDGTEDLDREMTSYRGALFAALDQSYGGVR